MTLPPLSERIVQAGQFGTVEYAVRASGSMEAKEWLDEQTDNKRASFAVLFSRKAEIGRINNVRQYRQLEGTIYEFKRAGDRILCCMTGNRTLLTHHFNCTFGNRPGLCHQGDEVLGEFDDFSWQSAGDGSRGKFGL